MLASRSGLLLAARCLPTRPCLLEEQVPVWEVLVGQIEVVRKQADNAINLVRPSCSSSDAVGRKLKRSACFAFPLRSLIF